ncbi:hypothetical protein ACFRQM_04440 [Streptomyces sp. NPDC056831]|uniref:hypothetical protein n=1 Tax=Streptomyces sp. NPDC056831 TaxID=3345954 RepID=UPI00367E5573
MKKRDVRTALDYLARLIQQDNDRMKAEARGELTPEQRAERRADIAETELRTLRAGIRSLGGDPTTIQNLWAQLRMRNRQWRESKHEAERFKADHLAACRTIAEMHEAATGRTGMGPVRGVVEDVADVRARAEKAEATIERMQRTNRMVNGGARQDRERAEKAERRAYTAEQALRDRMGVDNTERAEKAEKALAAMEAERNRERKYSIKAAQRLATADQRARLANDRAVTAERAAAHVTQVEAGRAMWKSKAEAIERDRDREAAAREQAQQDAKAAEERARIAHVHAHRLSLRTPTAAERTLDRIRNARHTGTVWTELGMYYGMTPEQAGQGARAWRTTAEAHAQKAEERAEAAARIGTRHMADAERYQAAWQNARLRAKQANEREQKANARAERYRDTRRKWLEIADEFTDKQHDRAAAAEAVVARVRRLLDTHLGPLATAAVRAAIDTPTEG